MRTCHTPYPESQSLILALPESSLKPIPYSTFLDTISHSDVTDFLILPMQQPSPQALCCLARYSLLANIQHPAKRRCSLSLFLTRSAPFSVSPLTSLQALVLIACSIIDIMVDVSHRVKFCSSHIFCYSYTSLFSSRSLWSILLFVSMLVWIFCPVFFLLISDLLL